MNAIDHETAEKLRAALSGIQEKCLSGTDAEPLNGLELVNYVSEVGFGLVDELEGVVR